LMTWLHQDHWLREVGSNHRVFRLTVGRLTAWLPRNTFRASVDKRDLIFSRDNRLSSAQEHFQNWWAE
jgi:hypothetical protein